MLFVNVNIGAKITVLILVDVHEFPRGRYLDNTAYHGGFRGREQRGVRCGSESGTSQREQTDSHGAANGCGPENKASRCGFV